MFQSSAMQHFVCLLLVLSLAGVSTAAEPVTSGETAYSALETTLAEQVRASAAEQEYREYQRNSAERLKQLGQAPAEELRDAYELATQAAEWSRLLNLQQTRLHAVNPSAPDHTDGIILRVPGLPAAFFDDPIGFIFYGLLIVCGLTCFCYCYASGRFGLFLLASVSIEHVVITQCPNDMHSSRGCAAEAIS